MRPSRNDSRCSWPVRSITGSLVLSVASLSCASGADRARRFDAGGLLPLPLGEGWGEGLRSIDRAVTPSPQPSPHSASEDARKRADGGERERTESAARSLRPTAQSRPRGVGADQVPAAALHLDDVDRLERIAVLAERDRAFERGIGL